MFQEQRLYKIINNTLDWDEGSSKNDVCKKWMSESSIFGKMLDVKCKMLIFDGYQVDNMQGTFFIN